MARCIYSNVCPTTLLMHSPFASILSHMIREQLVSQSYLEDQADGLVVQLSTDRAKERYRLLAAYIQRFRAGLGRKRAYFLDLRAGSGKVKCSPSGVVLRTPPLAALTTQNPFQGCWFAEPHKPEREALEQRIRASEQRQLVEVLSLERLPAVQRIAGNIRTLTGNYSALAYLDAENAGLDWAVVEVLHELPQAELLFDFSSVGLVKGGNVMYDKGRQERFDAFFGTTAWRKPYQRTGRQDKTQIRRALIDFYRERLRELGYTQLQEIVPEAGSGAQYRLLYAAQGADRGKLWQDALRSTRQLPLF